MWAWALQHSCFTEIALLDAVLGSWNPGWLLGPGKTSQIVCSPLHTAVVDGLCQGEALGDFLHLCLPCAARWGTQVLPALKHNPKHGWWVQRGTFLALQHWEFGHGEEKYLAIILPASGFQLWPLSCKAGAKLVSPEVMPSEPMTSWSTSQFMYMDHIPVVKSPGSYFCW